MDEQRRELRTIRYTKAVEDNEYMCVACGAKLWDERKHRPQSVFSFKSKAGERLYACKSCGLLVGKEG